MKKSTSERLVEMLEAVGFRRVVVTPARGAWRTDVRLDVYRWEGRGESLGHTGLPDGLPVTFASWDTMTDCMKHGIILDEGDSGAVGDFLVNVLSSANIQLRLSRKEDASCPAIVVLPRIKRSRNA